MVDLLLSWIVIFAPFLLSVVFIFIPAKEAADIRRQLLARIGSNSVPLDTKMKSIAIDGIFAGPDPIDDSADYLEMLANLVKQQPPQPQ